MSTFFVEPDIVKGPKVLLASVSLGKSLRLIVTLALPLNALKSGINLLIFIKNSPSPMSGALTSKSPLCILAIIASLAPVAETWSVPNSC